MYATRDRERDEAEVKGGGEHTQQQRRAPHAATPFGIVSRVTIHEGARTQDLPGSAQCAAPRAMTSALGGVSQVWYVSGEGNSHSRP